MGRWPRAILASAVISAIAASVFARFLGAVSDQVVLASVGLGVIAVGIPAFLGIVLVQRPAKRWAEQRGYRPRGIWATVTGANIVVTCLAGVAVMRPGVTDAPVVLGILAGCAIVAAAIWLIVEWKFGERNG